MRRMAMATINIIDKRFEKIYGDIVYNRINLSEIPISDLIQCAQCFSNRTTFQAKKSDQMRIYQPKEEEFSKVIDEIAKRCLVDCEKTMQQINNLDNYIKYKDKYEDVNYSSLDMESFQENIHDKLISIHNGLNTICTD